MSTTSHTRYGSSRRATGAAVGSTFAGVMLVTLGIFQMLQGLTAVLNDDIFVRTDDYLYALDITQWGWIHLGVGALAIAIGIGLFANQTWANAAGIGCAVLSAISSFMFLPYYPLWSMLVIAFDVFVIWALCVQIGDRDES